MGKLKKIIFSLFCLLVIPFSVNAASGTISITGTSQVVIGNTVTINVVLSSKTKIGSWDMDLNYDKNYLQLISATSEAGGVNMVNSSAGVTSKSYTFKFKALKKGNTKISMASYQAFAYEDMSEMNLSASSKTVKIMTQEELEATYSKDNYLKSLSVEGFEITPEFNKDVADYSVVVPENTKEITINAAVNDSKSDLSGVGTVEVTQGTNTFQIVVRAQNGSERTYNLTVEVKDENPINVTIDNQDYTVVKIKEYLPSVNAYQETTVNINDFEIPAYKSELTGFVLVGLKDSSGNINLYIYDEENNSYKVYNELKFTNITIYPKDTKEILNGYKSGEITINEVQIPAYFVSESSRFAIIYGINVETGEEGFFKYDKKNQTAIKYDDEMINLLTEKNRLYTYIIFGFIGTFILMFIILIVIVKNKKKKPKKENKKVEEENEKLEIREENKTKEIIYDNIDNNKKKKNKNKK